MAAMVVAPIALCAVEVGDPLPCLLWNATASAPLGLYRVERTSPIWRGDLVLVRPPSPARAVAAERGYLPEGMLLVKRVEGLAGDVVCVRGGQVTIEGIAVANALQTDGVGRLLDPWAGCRALASHEVFVLMRDVPGSFDSRYFGPVLRSDVLGKAVPLWTW